MERIEVLRKEIKEKTAGPQAQYDITSLNDLYVKIEYVRKSWRNPTMHVERRYDPEEAEDVFGQVVSLMDTLREKLE